MGNNQLKKISEKIALAKNEIELEKAVVRALQTTYEGHKRELDQLLINLKYLEEDWKIEAQKQLEKLEDKKGETQS